MALAFCSSTTTGPPARHAELRRVPRPSTGLRALTDTGSTIAEKRGTDERTLISQLGGDLDWIVMMAMEKERERRYSSASELAADLQRHLNNEPVSASPPAASYRLKKFVRRNRVAVLAGVFIFVALIAGVIGTTWGMVSASRSAQSPHPIEDRDARQRANRTTVTARSL